MSEQIDVITIGRISMDLFATNIGANFEDITGFANGVGGSPSNIAIGTSRLGLNVALMTAVGQDRVGDFVLRSLRDDGVNTAYIPRKPQGQTGLAILGVQPPDQFPLTFYRQDPSDIYINIDDIDALPLDRTKRFLISGTAVSRGDCVHATLYAGERARALGVIVYADLDLRPDQWRHKRAYGVMMRTLWSSLDVVIGTEEELYAALAPNPDVVMDGGRVSAEMQTELSQILDAMPHKPTIVRKLGPDGVAITPSGEKTIHVPGYPVEILNTVGAGDAFASGLLYGRTQGWNWYKSGRFANACGAIVVTRHGCGTAMPTVAEVEAFVAPRGGL